MEKKSRDKFSWLIVLPLIIAAIIIVGSLVYQAFQDSQAVNNRRQINFEFQGAKFKVVYPEKLYLEKEDGVGQPIVISAFDGGNLPNSEIFQVKVEPGEHILLKDSLGQPIGNVYKLLSGDPEKGAVKIFLVPLGKNNSLPSRLTMPVTLMKQDGPKSIMTSTIYLEMESSVPTTWGFIWKRLFGETAFFISAIGVIISGIAAFWKIRNEQFDRQEKEDEKDEKEKRVRLRQEIKNIEEMLQNDRTPENVIKIMQIFKHMAQQSQQENYKKPELAALETMRMKLIDRQVDILRLIDETYREDEQEAFRMLGLLQDVMNPNREA